MSIKQKYDRIIKYTVNAKLDGPLHIGDSSGIKSNILIHPVDRVPFIQASSLAGLFRDDCENPDGIYGSAKSSGSVSDAGSSVVFTDARIYCSTGEPVIEIRPRVRISPDTGTVSNASVKGSRKESGQKFDMQYVGTGAEVSFSIYVYEDSSDKSNEIERSIISTLIALNEHDLSVGGQQSNGCGLLSIKSVRYRLFDMRTEDGRKSWSLHAFDTEEPDAQYELIGKNLWNKYTAEYKSRVRYRVTVTGSTENDLIVKAISVTGRYTESEKEPDSENIRNASEQYIIPGSSFKGAIRSQMQKISGYLERKGTLDDSSKLIDEIFGYTANDTDSSSDDSRHGVISFRDTVIQDSPENSGSDDSKVKCRIHIDKFTGGVMDGQLFQETYVFGDGLKFVIELTDRWHQDDTDLTDKALGLLMLALRDLAGKLFNLGGEYSIGKGFIDVSEINIVTDDLKKASVNFGTGSVKDPDDIIKHALNSLED